MLAPDQAMDASPSIIAGLEEQLTRAIGSCDGPACGALLGDDFTAIAANEGQALVVTLRADWLKSISSGRARTFSIDDTAVSVHGNVAIATVLLSEKEHEVTQLLVTDVWRRTGDAWILFERHAGRPAPA